MKVRNFKQIIKNGISLLAISLVIGACQYKDLGEAVYPAEIVYLSAAVGGFYDVSTVPAFGATRYSVDLGAKKFNIPLAIVRSGVSNSGAFSASIAANTDTLGLLIAANRLVAEALPAENYALPTSVNGEAGKDNAPFNLSIDLDYLRNNATKKFAVAVRLKDAQPSLNVGLSTAIVTIDAKMLKPVANFTSKVTAKTVAFTNTSTYGVSYAWDFGNGSAVSTAAAPTYTYTAAGTYTVKLTTTGITGSQDANVKTLTVTVL
jgi:PKD repeat protein